jgi:hypothetical protein
MSAAPSRWTILVASATAGVVGGFHSQAATEKEPDRAGSGRPARRVQPDTIKASALFVEDGAGLADKLAHATEDFDALIFAICLHAPAEQAPRCPRLARRARRLRS